MPKFDVPRPEKAIKKKKEKKEKERKRKKHKKHKKHKKKRASSSSHSSSSSTESPRRAAPSAPLPPQDTAFANTSRAVGRRASEGTTLATSQTALGRHNKLFVGSLAWTTTEDTLRQLFGKFGECECRVVCERDDPTRSRGFAFVSFSDEAAMLAASSALDGVEVDGRQIKVNNAQPRVPDGSDWTCPRCSATCFASRRECFKCRTPRSSGDRDQEGFAGAGGTHWRDRAPASAAAAQSGSSAGRQSNYKYNASARKNMDKTVAEEAEEDDEARMRAYLARKAARDRENRSTGGLSSHGAASVD